VSYISNRRGEAVNLIRAARWKHGTIPANRRVSATDETVWGTRLRSRLTTETARLDYHWKFGVSVVRPTPPLVLPIPLVFCAGEPKDGFAGGTHTPIYQIYTTICCLNDWPALAATKICLTIKRLKGKLWFFCGGIIYFTKLNKEKVLFPVTKTLICRLIPIFFIINRRKLRGRRMGGRENISGIPCRRRRAGYARL